MPWLEESADALIQQWQTFLKNALRKRVDARDLEAPLHQLSGRVPLASRAITHILLRFRDNHAGFDDPLLFQYARLLLKTKIINPSDLLSVLLEHSPFLKDTPNDKEVKSKTGLPTCEERLLTLLISMLMSGDLNIDKSNCHDNILILTRWLATVDQYESAKQLQNGALHAVDAIAYNIYQALANLVFIVFSFRVVRDLPHQAWWEKRRATVRNKLEQFDAHVLRWMQSPFSGRLQALASMPPFVDTDANGRPQISGQQVLETVNDLPISHSRAGLYIWLNSCLCSRPFTDDLSILTYLQNRYLGAYQPLFVDLIIASFDVLTGTMLRKEPRQSVKVVCSFICNKVPVNLSMISSYLAPRRAEACIQTALLSVLINPLPPISAGSNDIQEMLKRTRLEFLQSCALHGLISEAGIESILQEQAIALPRIARYTREGLVAQCNNNLGRLESLADDLDGMQGNAGAIAGCIVDVVNNLSAAKDTMSLKTICMTLIKKLPSMDILFQYVQPIQLLQPLCTLLNEWTHDQEQMEFTPSYEEFATILLFLQSVCNRYDITNTEMGLTTPDTTLAKILRSMRSITPLDELTDQQSGQLSKWVEGLFSTDEQGDTSGIGDEVMRQCPPGAFYVLVPTLFEQSVLACKSDLLSMKTFKGGLELLLEPFLLPSLLGGLSWLIQHSTEDHGDGKILLQILDKLLKAPSTSPDTQAMHRAVMGVIATPLSQSLDALLLKQPERKEAQGLIDLLKPYIGRDRRAYALSAQLDKLLAANDGSFEQILNKTISQLVTWCTSVGPNPPPPYAHPVIEACRVTLGAQGLVQALAVALKQQTAVSNTTGSVALDICTSIICAPSSFANPSPPLPFGTSKQHERESLSLREALSLTLAETSKLLDMPSSEAEALVRLSRQVERQCAVIQIPQIPLPLSSMPEQTADEIMADFGLTTGDAAVSNATGLSQAADLMQSSDGDLNIAFASTLSQPIGMTGSTAPNLEISGPENFLDAIATDMPQTEHAETMNAPQSADEDIFAGLSMLGEDFTFA